jgi:hypothetical protein
VYARVLCIYYRGVGSLSNLITCMEMMHPCRNTHASQTILQYRFVWAVVYMRDPCSMTSHTWKNPNRWPR